MKKLVSFLIVALFSVLPQITSAHFNRDLTFGTAGHDVVELNDFLISQKLLYLPKDIPKDIFSRYTRDALLKYQLQNNISPAGGYFGAKTRAKIASGASVSSYAVSTTNTATSLARTLSVGSTGPDVVALQNFLISQKLLVIPAGVAKGTFGALTREALKAYQARNYIKPATGILDIATRAKINPILASQKPSVSADPSKPVIYPPTNTPMDMSSHPTSDPQVVRNPTSQSSNELNKPVTKPVDNTPENPVASNNWSNAATWGGSVPQAGAKVVIPAGKTIVLDTNTPNIGSLEINGTLEVARKDVTLTAGYIVVNGGGQFIAGTKASPFANKLNIILTGTDRSATAMGGRVFGAMNGGKIDLIGTIPSFNWTMLASGATAQKGATSITLDKSSNWKVGDEFIITSTDYDYGQTEKRTITGINGATVTFSVPLNYLHYGVITQVDHNVSGVPHDIDERAEVGLLTHNIRIQGAQGIPGVEDATANGYGGHVMIMDDASVAHVEGVEFYNMGQKGILGRYPIHWHNVNNGGSNSYILSSSVNHSFNRGTTIHKTNNLTLSENVIYDTLGHGYFIEDGKETGNVFTHNLVALVNFGPLDANFLLNAHTPERGEPAAYWITNPNNTFINNAAAGAAPGGFGFWYDLHPLLRPGSISAAADPSYNPRNQPFGGFRGNRAHSIAKPLNGDNVKGAWAFFMDEFTVGGPVPIDDFTSFKVQGGQVWFNSGVDLSVRKSHLAGDNTMWNPHPVVDSLVVGRTANPTVIDPQGESRNINMSGFDTTIGQNSLIGYDFVGIGKHSVFANFRGIFKVRHDGIAGGYCESCTYLNNSTYKTYFMANTDNKTPEDAEKSQFFSDDPGDAFGNGSPGMFTYSELYIDNTCKSGTQGAKGVEPTDNLGYWCPYSSANFVVMGFDKREGFQAYQVYNQPEGKNKVYPAVERSDNNGGRTQVSVIKLNTMQKITFKGKVENENIIIDILGGQTPQNDNSFVLLAMPAPTAMPTVSPSPFHTGIGEVASIVNSRSEFDSAQKITAFLDQSNSILYVKFPVSLKQVWINGYTLAPEVTASAQTQTPAKAIAQAPAPEKATNAFSAIFPMTANSTYLGSLTSIVRTMWEYAIGVSPK